MPLTDVQVSVIKEILDPLLWILELSGGAISLSPISVYAKDSISE